MSEIGHYMEKCAALNARVREAEALLRTALEVLGNYDDRYDTRRARSQIRQFLQAKSGQSDDASLP